MEKTRLLFNQQTLSLKSTKSKTHFYVKVQAKSTFRTVNTVRFVKLSSGMEIPVSTCQLGARHSPNRAGNVWNPSAFIEKGKQANDQRQPVGSQTQVRRGREARAGERGVYEMRQTVLAARGHRSYKGSELQFGGTGQKHCGPWFC